MSIYEYDAVQDRIGRVRRERVFGCEYEPAPRPLPPGHHRIGRPKPRTHHYSYSNADSQGALICETPGFPDSYDPETHDLHCAYSDRIDGWDRGRFKRACELAGGGDQAWAFRLPGKSRQDLIAFAKVALNVEDRDVVAVRVVHHFNVSNGYSCPTVEALVAK